MDRKSLRRQIIIWLILILLIGGAIAYFTYFKKYFSLDTIHRHREQLLNVVEHHYVLSVAIYLLLYILLTCSSLPIPGIMTIIGGFMYGIVWGMIYSNIAAITASIIIFYIVRHVLGKRLQEKYAKRFMRFNRLTGEYGASYILLIQLTAIFPYFVVAFAAGITKIPFWTFLWSTAVGIIPGSYVYAFAGQKIGTVDKFSDIFTLEFYIAVGVFIGVVLLATWWRKHYGNGRVVKGDNNQ